MPIKKIWKEILQSAGLLLGVMAIISKALGILRDRMLIDFFTTTQADSVFIALRITDFFFILFIGSAISVMLIPRLQQSSDEQQKKISAKFFGNIFFGFGVLCLVGFYISKYLVIFLGGIETQQNLASTTLITKYLFISIWIMALGIVFSSWNQVKNIFWTVALAPIFYTGGIIAGLIFFAKIFGIFSFAIGAIFGATLMTMLHGIVFFIKGGRLKFSLHRSFSISRQTMHHYTQRLFNNIPFQINQTADIFIAGLIGISGAVSAFNIGTNTGQILLSIVGIPIATSIFPTLAKKSGQRDQQKKLLFVSVFTALKISVPISILGAIVAKPALMMVFSVEGTILQMMHLVFVITILTLPLAVLIPIFSRFFLANKDTKTPLIINTVSLISASIIAYIFCIHILPTGPMSILGLGIGTAWANIVSTGLFWWKVYRI